ncbi:MAG: hypothetical protein LPH21_06015, partial [Shewanella sp.]|nr:hypothetical protein [Shewanella sp.]
MKNISELFINKSSTLSKGKTGNIEFHTDDFDDNFKYFYSKEITIEKLDLNSTQETGFYFECGGESDICGGLIFFDEKSNKIDSIVKSSNQIFSTELPLGTHSISLCLRIPPKKKITLTGFLVGDYKKLQAKVNELNSFDCNAFLRNISSYQNRKILIETIFCDTEQREHALEKYFSFFSAQMYLM